MIPNNSEKIQEGLYRYLHSFVVGGTLKYNSRLYSADGYCFCDSTIKIYDEEGNLIPNENVLPTQRQYMQYISTPLTDVDELNNIYVSVPIQEGFEIV